jgi:methionyl-tRNA formyltransferase
LCGPPDLPQQYTCATLIREGFNVVGLCVADQRSAGLPLSYLRLSVRKKGLWVTLSRVAARLLYQLLNRRQDRRKQEQVFDAKAIRTILDSWKGEWHYTQNYSAPATLAWLQAMDADIFVAHTSYWVGKQVRDLPKTKIVLGGHPGLTPYYRGSHAAFWAIFRGHPDDVGCTVFVLDKGVDTGDIVAQERLPIEPGDSFISLGWKGMKRTAELQAAALHHFAQSGDIPRQRVPVPEHSEFDNPTLGDYLRYLWRQQQVR